MPRRARIKHGGESHHIIQRGNNRSACFFSAEDYRFYLESVAAGAARYHCAIHAYVLMTNHVHLLATPRESEGLSLMMRYLGSRYVRYVNSVYKRSGTLWGGRYKSSVIDSERSLLSCCRYIEFNPVRAGILAAPSDYPLLKLWRSCVRSPGRSSPRAPLLPRLGQGRPSTARGVSRFVQ